MTEVIATGLDAKLLAAKVMEPAFAREVQQVELLKAPAQTGDTVATDSIRYVFENCKITSRCINGR